MPAWDYRALALSALAAGALAAAVGAATLFWSSSVPDLGGISVLLVMIGPVIFTAVAGLALPIFALRRRAYPRWASVTGLVLGIVAALWAAYLLVGGVAVGAVLLIHRPDSPLGMFGP
jgi:hypothetical protein